MKAGHRSTLFKDRTETTVHNDINGTKANLVAQFAATHKQNQSKGLYRAVDGMNG